MGESTFNSRLSPLVLAELWMGRKVFTTWSEIQNSKGLCLVCYEGTLRDESGKLLWIPDLEARGYVFFEMYDREFDEMTLVTQSDEIVLDEMDNGVMFKPYVQVSREDGCIQVFSQEEFASDPRFSRRAA